MTRSDAYIDECEVEALILRSLVRKLMEKSLLSQEDVRAILLDAVKGLDIVVRSTATIKAANDVFIDGD